MDIPDEVESTSRKKAPKLKNLRRSSFSNYNDTLDVKDAQQITKHRRASFGNSLSVDLAIVVKKSKATEVERKNRENPKKNILQRMRSTEESTDSFDKNSKKSKLRLSFAKSRKTNSLDLTSKDHFEKQKMNFETVKKEMKKLTAIPDDQDPDSSSKAKSTTLTGIRFIIWTII